MRARSLQLSLLVTLVATALLLPADMAREKAAPEPDRTFNAVAISVGGVVTGATRLTIRVTRWSTDEERQALLDSIGPQRDQRKLYDELQKQESTGSIKPTGELAYTLRYARRYEDNGREILVLATDRPLFWEEFFAGGRSREYNVALLVLDLDPETGKGTGQFSLGTRLRWDDAEHHLVIETAGTQVVQLTSVTETKTSLKKRGARK